MKYYIDTEFIEGTQKTFFGKSKPTIDLISIGIICEDGREFYAISKDFNLKEAWNRYQIKTDDYGIEEKVYWLRDNVLKPIYKELFEKERYAREYHWNLISPFSYKTLKTLISWNGKTNKQIAKEVCDYIDERKTANGTISPGGTSVKQVMTTDIQFYGYYSDYDWVVFCWLFGKMIDLPDGFPMYCNDLKQILDEKQLNWSRDDLKKHPNYPKQTNKHNALADAHFNKQLHEFLNTI